MSRTLPATITNALDDEVISPFFAVELDFDNVTEDAGSFTSGEVYTILTTNDNSQETITLIVTVSGGVFYIDGDPAESLIFLEESTYRFDVSDSSNSGHPLRFSETNDGTHNSGTEYTTGVTVSGTAGTAGAYVEITVADGAPTPLYYYCSNHSGMGSSITVNIYETDFTEIGAANNTIGTVFTATGVGTGTGSATKYAPLRLWTGVGTLNFNGYDWTGAGTLLSVSAIEETTETAAKGADITVTNLPSEILALALKAPYQGRTGKIYFGVSEASMTEIFSGYMDQMNIVDAPDGGSIQVSLENKLIDLERARIARYTGQFQKSRNITGASADIGFDFVEDLQDQKLSWGRASE